MRNVVLALAALIALPSAAMACSCINTDDPDELRTFAQDSVRGAVALIELEAITSYDPMKDEGEKVRVVRTLAGEAPESFQLERRKFASGASCDDVFEARQRKLVLLYPVEGSANYRVSSLCTNLLLEKPVFRDAVAAGIGQVGERG
jgi:hypothetical protein